VGVFYLTSFPFSLLFLTMNTSASLTVADLVSHLLTLPQSAPVVKFDGMGANEPIASFPPLNSNGEFDINESETYYNTSLSRIVCMNTCLTPRH
jgi:hypothetical protein